jgi:hypothetical protein
MSRVSDDNTIALGGTGAYAVNVCIGKTSGSERLDVVGNAKVSGQFISGQATGTAPTSVQSTTVNTNFNADMLDGKHAVDFLGLSSLTDPGADRIVFWDETDNLLKWLACGNSVAITTTTLDAIQDIRTTAGPTFDHLHLTTDLPVSEGGTGASTFALNGVLYGNAANAIGVTAIGAEGQFLRVGASPFVPAWSTLTLPNTGTAYRLPVFSAANVMTELAAVGATGQYLAGNTGAIPSWANISAFEPALGNPGTTGWVLSSTDAGVRSWIASGGGGTFLSLTDVDEADYTGHAAQFVVVNGTEDGLVFSASSVAGHAVLSASHTDSAASAVSRGSLIYGNSTPKWAELAVGSAGQVVTTDGTDVSWGAVPAHDLLSAIHGDTLADTVVRGDIMIGNSTPAWSRLAKGNEGYVLTMGANEPAWAESAAGSPGMVTLLNEPFDGLATAAISGQGSYTYFGAWAVTLVGTSTATVAVKSGADKMGVLTGDTVTEGSSYVYLNTSAAWPWGLCYGTRFHFKMRTSDVTIGTKGWNLGSDSDVDECQVYFRTTGSKITFWSGSANTDMMTAVNNTWYTIDVFIIDGTTSPHALVFIDGVQMAGPKACGANTENWNRVGFYCNTTGTASPINLDFDDFYIGTNWFFDLVD